MADKAKQKKLYVDISRMIEIHNENNPDNPIDRQGLADKAETTYQTLTNYNGGVVSNGFIIINKLLEVSGAKYEEVVKEK